MKRSSKTISDGRSAIRAFAVLGLAAAIRVCVAGADDDQSLSAKVLAPSNSNALIECTTPDGRVIAIPTASSASQASGACLSDSQTLSCPLQEGRTTFVIKLPATSQRDRFIFVNENAAAAGELKFRYQMISSGPD